MLTNPHLTGSSPPECILRRKKKKPEDGEVAEQELKALGLPREQPDGERHYFKFEGRDYYVEPWKGVAWFVLGGESNPRQWHLYSGQGYSLASWARNEYDTVANAEVTAREYLESIMKKAE